MFPTASTFRQIDFSNSDRLDAYAFSCKRSFFSISNNISCSSSSSEQSGAATVNAGAGATSGLRASLGELYRPGSRSRPRSTDPLESISSADVLPQLRQRLRARRASRSPTGLNTYGNALREASRQTVNAWIRSSHFDAVLNFDAVVRDPANHSVIASKYDSGDGLHMNPAGYSALAASIPLSLFE
ncbi:hypothetical protein FA10DRAFT_201290 [Acaromyces ingoldii]|uniref:SGNH hydrolase-type esterase domain-containing protein n=1 Tax=Acaromyces ingoldii TaxID=215250 RepID=A0A316YC51_9BASI|nr:hypothetical protein FA10DRAFT_201290 [Acaromyces ingoldii]PWN86852.1 hypothetical protein FA10DRAFT_201290 [Acaromyces ingoldii]